MATASLTEPHVLAHTKRRLFPDDAVSSTYAVANTQFAMDEWLPGHPISQDVREQLAPFNHVQLGSGYPDLVGVRRLESDLFANSPSGEQPPLITIEAKGLTESGTVDIDRGVIQAYHRLHEANVIYLAAPTSGDVTISASACSGAQRRCAGCRRMRVSTHSRSRVSSGIGRLTMRQQSSFKQRHRVPRTNHSDGTIRRTTSVFPSRSTTPTIRRDPHRVRRPGYRRRPT